MKIKKNRVMSALLTLLVCAFCSREAHATVFGFNYWPQDYNCNILENANWTPANKLMVEQDRQNPIHCAQGMGI